MLTPIQQVTKCGEPMVIISAKDHYKAMQELRDLRQTVTDIYSNLIDISTIHREMRTIEKLVSIPYHKQIRLIVKNQMNKKYTIEDYNE